MRIMFFAAIFTPQLLFCLRGWQISEGKFGMVHIIACTICVVLAVSLMAFLLGVILQLQRPACELRNQMLIGAISLMIGALAANILLIPRWFAGIVAFGSEPNSHELDLVLLMTTMALQGFGGSVLWDCRHAWLFDKPEQQEKETTQ